MLDLLIDNRYWLCLLTVLVWAWFFWALKRSRVPVKAVAAGSRYTTKRVALPPKKAADIAPLNRTSTGGLAPSIEAGIAEHQARGSAATAKLPSQAASTRSGTTDNLDIPAAQELDDESHAAATLRDDSFAAQAAAEAAIARGPTTPMERSERLREIGFHHPIETDKLPEAPALPPAVPAATPSTPVYEAPTHIPTPKPRTQTAELDDILKRIDKVLSESPAPAGESPKPAPPTAPPRVTEKLDPADVLKRIDDALAEGHGGRAAQATMPRPGWADEAKRAATEIGASDPKPAVAQPSRKTSSNDVPDWAKADVQDDDLSADEKKDKKDADGKGGAAGQQKLF